MIVSATFDEFPKIRFNLFWFKKRKFLLIYFVLSANSRIFAPKNRQR